MQAMQNRPQAFRTGPPARSVFDVFHLRRGFTLIELLVVIAIISAVTIATVPMILPALDVRRIREASRILSTHFASAQSEAIATGRSVGVWIQRLSGEPAAAMDLFLCEVPAPYAGDSTSSQANCQFASGNATITLASDTAWYNLLKAGDTIRLNYGGPVYQFTGMSEQGAAGSGNFVDATQEYPANSGTYVLKPDKTLRFQVISTSVSNPTIRWPAAASSPGGWNASYQIYRQPIRSAGSAVQMPAGAVIDLVYSGIGAQQLYQAPPTVSSQTLNETQFRDSQTSTPDGKANRSLPIIVTFNKQGGLDSLYMRGPLVSGKVQIYPIKLTEPIHFLVGKRNKLPAPTGTYDATAAQDVQAETYNFKDMENIWVSINPQTGLVTTAEVASSSGSNLTAHLTASRTFATSAQTMGGR
jgi:prepilin-type N-terminal cleavage/methylation domain-containing protein